MKKLVLILLTALLMSFVSCSQEVKNIRKIVLTHEDLVTDCDVNKEIPCKEFQFERLGNEQLELAIPYIGGNGSDRVYVYGPDQNMLTFENAGNLLISTQHMKDGAYMLSLNGCNTGGGIKFVLTTKK